MMTLSDLDAADFPDLDVLPGEITGAEYRAEYEELISRWLIRPELAHYVALWAVYLRIRYGIRIRIISGRRDLQGTLDLIISGRPAVLNSQHRLGNAVDYLLDPEYNSVYAVLAGLLWTSWGFTWGGLFCRPDWNHIDGRKVAETLPGFDVRIGRAVESIKAGVFQWKSAC